MKNKNALNVKGTENNPWQGQTGLDEKGHAIFATMAESVRAAWICFDKKWQNGKRTIMAICVDWAPPNDHQGGDPGRPMNDPEDYAYFVAKYCKLLTTDTLPRPISNPAPWLAITRGMSVFEHGEPVDWISTLAGAALALDHLCGVEDTEEAKV